MDIEDDEPESQPEPDVDVDAFLAACREKHRGALEVRTRTIKCWENPCPRCDGYGQAPSPVGYVRCGQCRGTGADPEKWERVKPKVKPMPKPKRARKAKTLPMIINPGVKP